MDVKIYIELSSKTPRRLKRMCGFVLECQVKGETVTRQDFFVLEETYHGATVRTLEKALVRITKPCEITVYASDAWALGMLTGQIRKWAKENFLTVKGDPITDQTAWMHIWLLIEKHGITTVAGPHAYTEWMQREMRAKHA